MKRIRRYTGNEVSRLLSELTGPLWEHAMDGRPLNVTNDEYHDIEHKVNSLVTLLENGYFNINHD